MVLSFHVQLKYNFFSVSIFLVDKINYLYQFVFFPVVNLYSLSCDPMQCCDSCNQIMPRYTLYTDQCS
jgi:hypothetical protein